MCCEYVLTADFCIILLCFIVFYSTCYQDVFCYFFIKRLCVSVCAARSSQCTICMEDFTLSEQVRRLPCNHVYHSACIVRWLEMVKHTHNSQRIMGIDHG